MSDRQWIPVDPQRGDITIAYSDGQVVRKERKAEASESGLGTLLFGAATGIGGYALGKKHGHDDGWREGYNQAKIEDSSAIQQLHQNLQQASSALYNMRQERDQHLQEMQRLRSANEVLMAIVREHHPTSAQTEAISKALQRVEFQLTGLLPPQFEAGGDGQNPKLN
jgi:flagellar biosynthesis/type III secretory pathway protein FliH